MASYDVATTRNESAYTVHAVCPDSPKPKGMLPIRVPALCGTEVDRFLFDVHGGGFALVGKMAEGSRWMQICGDCKTKTKEN